MLRSCDTTDAGTPELDPAGAVVPVDVAAAALLAVLLLLLELPHAASKGARPAATTDAPRPRPIN
jgi:hypothetical protein